MAHVSDEMTSNGGLSTCRKANWWGSCDPGHAVLVLSWADHFVIENSGMAALMMTPTSFEPQETPDVA